MNKLELRIVPNEEFHCSEVRILVDGFDILGKEYMGLDLASFFSQKELFNSGELMIGCCTCGSEGCSDFPVETTIESDRVIWKNIRGLKLVFDKRDFESALSSAQNDLSNKNKPQN